MAVNQIWSSDQTASTRRFRTTIWYDTTVQTLILQCDNGTNGQPGNGHGILDLEDNRASAPVSWNPTLIFSISCDQFNDGIQHIIAGPGAAGTGTDKNGNPTALPTATIPAALVQTIVAPRGQFPTMGINLRWIPV